MEKFFNIQFSAYDYRTSKSFEGSFNGNDFTNSGHEGITFNTEEAAVSEAKSQVDRLCEEDTYFGKRTVTVIKSWVDENEEVHSETIFSEEI